MTGPEHYARAEALLDAVRNKNFDDVDDEGRTVESYDAEADPTLPGMLAAAQVHATLALAAATLVGSEAGYSAHRVNRWEPALGPVQEPGTRPADLGPL